MPALVAAGDAARGITACDGCHYPNGKGRPQNANIAGLNTDYLVRQLHDMKNGTRKSAEPRKANAFQMAGFAKAMTDSEMREAAGYYAALPPTVRIRVVETATVPKMRSQEGLWLPDANGTREPIGERVIETPADVDREQLRDPHAGFIAYVPKGAVARGRRLAARLNCAQCHGEKGGGDGSAVSQLRMVPTNFVEVRPDIAEALRALRNGVEGTPMAPWQEKLSEAELSAVAYYVRGFYAGGR